MSPAAQPAPGLVAVAVAVAVAGSTRLEFPPTGNVQVRKVEVTT